MNISVSGIGNLFTDKLLMFQKLEVLGNGGFNHLIIILIVRIMA